ncbi:Fic family protein [Ancylomarina salipaludis]|uniref:Fic family protein n=1 Tax=Ancylomarina salipaludis TaxID=2501299 RepID=A0A4Q1JLA2_9BACT|nr:Fic family protein [Ancylomarina salipaludis]RXQ92926.1 Fic family protein [Ancylomarina salipaludis]
MKSKGNFINQTYREGYKSTSSFLINRSFEWQDKQINIMLESCMHRLGELNAYCKYFKDIDTHLPMFTAIEVTASNMMEGIRSNITQAFLPSASKGYRSLIAHKQVRNYINSIDWAVNELEKFPLSLHMIKETHRMLYADLPREEETAGKLRIKFNAKDNKYQESEGANYTPPSKQELKRLINDAKWFWRNEDLELPYLIKMAISLCQFETILPFLDGNGRTARTLILLELLSLKFIEKPIFCLSAFFEKNRLEYYHRLNLIRSKNDVEQWIRFFITGMSETASYCIERLEDLQALKTSYQERIETKLGKKRHPSAKQLLQIFYSKPYLSVNEIKEEMNLSFQSSNQLVKELEEAGFIKEMAGARRNRVFYLWEYLAIFEM